MTSQASKVNETAEALKSRAKDAAQGMRDDIAATSQAKMDEAKHGVADETANVATALRHAAQDMRRGSPQARTVGYAATALADISDAIERKDVSEFVQDAGEFARRNPLPFLGGAAALGFVLTRFAKASAERDEERYPADR